MVQNEVNRKTRIYGTVAVLSAIVLISMVYVFGAAPGILQSPGGVLPNPAVSGMRTFASNEELRNYLVNNSQQGNTYYWRGSGGFAEMIPSPTLGTAGTNDYSVTNVQVTGVDEADTVKTDGQYIYTISNQNTGYYGYYYYYGYSSKASVYIVNADPQNAQVVSKITFDNYTTPNGLFLSENGSRLVVISDKYLPYLASEGSYSSAIMPYYYNTGTTEVTVYDVQDKAQPVLVRNFTVSGSYFNSRMIGNDVYVVTSQDAWVYNDVVTLPVVYRDGAPTGASATTIYYADMNQSSYYSFTSFYGIDVANDQQQPTNMTVLMSGASVMYVSTGNIYVTYPNWVNGSQSTSIYRVKIDGLQLSFEAQGSVPGYTINQYAMDEYNGNLRIATNVQDFMMPVPFGSSAPRTTTQNQQTNNVFILNPDLAIIGKLEGLAQGENLHSVRFMGDRCYLVTFVKTDPLFVIDVSNPQSPRVLGELQIPGYSDYLHPYDETHLIGVGKEAVAADEGNFAWYQGLKVALFDVTDVNHPRLMSNYTIGDRGTDSEALYDPHAFLFDKEKNLLVIPVNLAIVSESARQQQGDSAYGDSVWQGAYVFNVSLDGGIQLQGTVTHQSGTVQVQSDRVTGQTMDPNYYITRALYIGNTLYTISNAEVKLNNLSDLTQIAEVDLN